jgi:hypothetical protein
VATWLSGPIAKALFAPPPAIQSGASVEVSVKRTWDGPLLTRSASRRVAAVSLRSSTRACVAPSLPLTWGCDPRCRPA